MEPITFVRHSLPEMVIGQPPATWGLSAEGRERATQLGEGLTEQGLPCPNTVASSTERKAIETAELLELGAVTVDERFGEISKPWYDKAVDHQTAACEYLGGEDLPGWEPRTEAIARFSAAVDELSGDSALVATHGTVLSLWLSERVDGFDAAAFWIALDMPDAWRFDPGTNSLSRLNDV